MYAARAQPGEMPLADQQPGHRGLLLLRERTSQRIALLPGARTHCISVGRSAAQQRGCVSIPPQPRRREVPANSICRAATGSSERCHASDQWRKRPRRAGWVTARLLSHLEAERLSPVAPAARPIGLRNADVESTANGMLTVEHRVARVAERDLDEDASAGD